MRSVGDEPVGPSTAATVSIPPPLPQVPPSLLVFSGSRVVCGNSRTLTKVRAVPPARRELRGRSVSFFAALTESVPPPTGQRGSKAGVAFAPTRYAVRRPRALPPHLGQFYGPRAATREQPVPPQPPRGRPGQDTCRGRLQPVYPQPRARAPYPATRPATPFDRPWVQVRRSDLRIPTELFTVPGTLIPR